MAQREYTISHSGGTLGEENVALAQNQVAPQRETPIAEFTGPSKFEGLEYVATRDPVWFVPRTVESITGSADDDTAVSLEADIQPIHGETDMDDQDYPVVRAVNVAQGSEVEIADVNYATDTVTLASNPAEGEEVKLYPIVTEGGLKWEGFDNLGRSQGVVYPWGFPIYRFHDFRQLQQGREINMHGSVSWGQYETVKLVMDSPRQLVWEDEDYPDAYVSTLEVDVTITI